MFKSFSQSIRSLWQSTKSETVTTSARKRKRSSDDSDLDDSDVEILSVKKPRQENTNSSSGILSFLTIPMSKMSNWVRKKTVRQDHVFVQPVLRKNNTQQGRGAGDDDLGLMNAPAAVRSGSGHSLPTTNGPLSHMQNTSQLSRQPIHSQNGSHENGVNGDVHIFDAQPGVCSLSSSSSRRSSCSSSIRIRQEKYSTVEQCFQLKEKQNYRKLLQQYTTIDLNDDDDGRRTSPTQTSPHTHLARGKPGLSMPSSSPSASSSAFLLSLPSSDGLGSKPKSILPSTRFRVCPNHSAGLLLPPSYERDKHSTAGAGKESVAGQGRSGWGQKAHSPKTMSPARHRSLQEKSDQNEGTQQADTSSPTPDTSSPTPDSSPDVVIIEDSNGSTSGKFNFLSSVYLDESWLEKLTIRYAAAEEERQRLIEEAEIKKKLLEERREERLGSIDKRLRQQMRLFDDEVEVIPDIPLPEVEQEIPLPELTGAMQKMIDVALGAGPQDQVLSDGFRLQLTRGDFATLRGLNWLNDEVINFYMNMVMERGEQEGQCKTYAFNTFFYPKVISGGHASVKRWTRKVDIFSHAYIVVPVHLGVHWCLCVVHIQEKCIRYYDSMGGNNNQCLNAIKQYLYDESLQKRNVQLDLSQWSTETVKDIPQQMNGSDCGMFSCMYAETLTRGAKINFTQADMPYFRRRMVYELLKKTLL